MGGVEFCQTYLADRDDRRPRVTPVKGPSGGLYSCSIGAWSAGTHAYVITATNSKGFSFNSSGTFTVAATLMVDASTRPQGSADVLTNAQIVPIAAEAIQRLESQLGSQVETVMAGVNIKVTNLSSGVLGETLGNTIWIDNDAAGYGWFVDPTPADDTEFVKLLGSDSLAAQNGTSAASRVDLLTTVMHEMGHVLGYDDTSSDGLMNGILPTGIRRSAVDEVFAKQDQV